MNQKNGTNWARNENAPHNVGGSTPHGERTVPRDKNAKNSNNNRNGNGGVNGTPRKPKQVVSRSSGRTSGQNGRPTAVPQRPTPEQLEARRKAEAKRKAAAKQRRETFFIRLAFTLGVYIILCLIIAGLIAVLYSSDAESKKSYSLKLMLDETKIYSASTGTMRADGGLYLPVNRLSQLCSITVAGDSKELLIYFHDGAQTLTVTKDSAVVAINDTPVRLGSKVLFSDDDVKLPVELFERYVDGITVNYDEDTAVCTVSKSSDEAVRLKLKAPEATPEVSDPEGTSSEASQEDSSQEVTR